MKGIILINAYTKTPGVLFQAQRLAEEFKAAGACAEIVKNNVFTAWVKDGNIAANTHSAQFAVLLDKDKYVPRMLEKQGMRVFNCSRAVELCDDKMLTHITLANHGIAMPDTLAAPLCYTAGTKVTDEYLNNITTRLGLPLIMKLSYGSLGNEVFFIDSPQKLKQMIERHMCRPHLYQRFISSSRGEDMRVIVIGGEVVAAMKRCSQTDFRSNLELGAKGYKATVSPQYANMCKKAAAVLGLDYCGIDVLRGENGEPVLCEVNSNAFFTGIESVSGVNVAGLYARHILQCTGQ